VSGSAAGLGLFTSAAQSEIINDFHAHQQLSCLSITAKLRPPTTSSDSAEI